MARRGRPGRSKVGGPRLHRSPISMGRYSEAQTDEKLQTLKFLKNTRIRDSEPEVVQKQNLNSPKTPDVTGKCCRMAYTVLCLRKLPNRMGSFPARWRVACVAGKCKRVLPAPRPASAEGRGGASGLRDPHPARRRPFREACGVRPASVEVALAEILRDSELHTRLANYSRRGLSLISRYKYGSWRTRSVLSIGLCPISTSVPWQWKSSTSSRCSGRSRRPATRTSRRGRRGARHLCRFRRRRSHPTRRQRQRALGPWTCPAAPRLPAPGAGTGTGRGTTAVTMAARSFRRTCC